MKGWVRNSLPASSSWGGAALRVLLGNLRHESRQRVFQTIAVATTESAPRPTSDDVAANSSEAAGFIERFRMEAAGLL